MEEAWLVREPAVGGGSVVGGSGGQSADSLLATEGRRPTGGLQCRLQSASGVPVDWVGRFVERSF